MLRDLIRGWWDDDADAYDDPPGHSLSDPVEAAAWRAALSSPPPARAGASWTSARGPGSISLLAAELGHDVTALDLSDAMLEQGAGGKPPTAVLAIDFVVGPAEEPPAGSSTA